MTALATIYKSGLLGIQAPIFEEPELKAIHRWCLKCRDLVRAGGTPPVTMPHQFKLPGFDDWLPEVSAAMYVGLDFQTLRDMRANDRKGITPFRECGGEYYYLRAALDEWLANNAKRRAARKGRKNPTSIGILA